MSCAFRVKVPINSKDLCTICSTTEHYSRRIKLIFYLLTELNPKWNLDFGRPNPSGFRKSFFWWKSFGVNERKNNHSMPPYNSLFKQFLKWFLVNHIVKALSNLISLYINHIFIWNRQNSQLNYLMRDLIISICSGSLGMGSMVSWEPVNFWITGSEILQFWTKGLKYVHLPFQFKTSRATDIANLP